MAPFELVLFGISVACNYLTNEVKQIDE